MTKLSNQWKCDIGERLRRNMKKIDITQFCAKDAFANQNIKNPWSIDGYTYATDRILLIRIPYDERWPDDTGPKLRGISFRFEPLSREKCSLIMPSSFDFCYCDEVEAMPCDSEPCDCECRWIEPKGVQQQTGFLFNQSIVYKIKDFTGLQFWFPTYSESIRKIDPLPAYFEFDGGAGLCMGMIENDL